MSVSVGPNVTAMQETMRAPRQVRARRGDPAIGAGARVQAVIWTLIGATGAADVILYAVQGMSIAVNWAVPAYLGALFCVSKLIERRYPPAARLLMAFVQLLTFCEVGGYLTYAVIAITPFPMADALLSRMDATLGFDWVGWFLFVKAHPVLHFILEKAYRSVPLQLVALLVFFAYADAKRIDETVLATILSIALILVGMFFLPAVGAWTQHGIGQTEPWRADILALRSHELLTVTTTKGIVCFPSFHTVCGVLLMNMARGRKWFAPVCVLNVILIASVMTEGAHYGVDMLSGLAVAVMAIAASRSILGWYERGHQKTFLLQRLARGEMLAQ